MRVWSTDLPAYVGERVAVAGWVQRVRRLSGVSFLIVRDGRGLTQVVVDDPDLLRRVATLVSESVVRVEGDALAMPRAPRGVELRADSLQVLAEAVEPPPFELHRPHIPAQLPTILDHAAIGVRHPRHRAIFQLSAAAVAGFRQTLRAEHFVEVFTPKLVGAATESGASVFEVDYFGRPAYLAQSPQLYKQILVGAFERVFEVGPAFRAEPHDTPRHLNAFTSLDAEMGFIEDHTTVMALLEKVIGGMLRAVAEEHEALALLACESPRLDGPIPRIEFEAALKLLEVGHGPLTGRSDLTAAGELWLGDWAQREHGSHFLFVVGYPLASRPFYTHSDPARPLLSNSFDLLFRGVEVVSGGQRLHRYADYVAALERRGIDPSGLSGYLEAFKHGMPPHGGFGLGLERWVARMIGATNVRETTLFPRDLQRLSP